MYEIKEAAISGGHCLAIDLQRHVKPWDATNGQCNPVVLYDCGSIVTSYNKHGRCEGKSITFTIDDEGLILLKDGVNNNYREEFVKSLYQTMHKIDYWFHVGKHYANNTDQTRRFRELGGVYTLRNNREVIYVGQTDNIFHRLSGHRDKEYDEVTFQPISDRTKRSRSERETIKHHKPKYNIMHNMVQRNIESGEYIEE